MAEPKTTSAPRSEIHPDIHATCKALDIEVHVNVVNRCPVCGNAGSAKLFGGYRFKCHHADCGVSATSYDLIALHVDDHALDDDGHFPRLTREQMMKVRAFIADHNITSTTTTSMKRPSGADVRAPYGKEVAQLWAAAKEEPLDPPCLAWLRARKLDEKAVMELGLARTLPVETDAETPSIPTPKPDKRDPVPRPEA